MAKRACLSGSDLSNLLQGEVITAFGVEFSYDGAEVSKIQQGLDVLLKRSGSRQPFVASPPPVERNYPPAGPGSRPAYRRQ